MEPPLTPNPARPAPPRELGRVRGREPGPTLIVVGGQHGNEPAGLEAARRVLAELARSGMALRGEFLALAGNVGALARGVRYQDHDLNRAWSDAHLEKIRRQPPEADDAEEREHRELLAAIDGAIARARGEVFLIDLHTTSAAGVPFVLFGDTLRQRAFGAHFPITVLLGLEEQVDGVLSQLMTRRGVVALAVEGGQHDDPHSIDALEACIWVGLGAATISAGQNMQASQHLLDRRRAHLPRVIEVRRRHAVHAEDGFAMQPGFANIGPAARGTLLAHQGGREVIAEEDGYVLLPLYQGQGSDGFFWGRPVSPLAWKATAALRRLGVDRALSHLPGVARDPSVAEGDALVLDAEASGRYPSALFLALGYRRERRDGGRIARIRAPE
jgi:succinylglutamate desuccinylase